MEGYLTQDVLQQISALWSTWCYLITHNFFTSSIAAESNHTLYALTCTRMLSLNSSRVVRCKKDLKEYCRRCMHVGPN